MAGGATPLGRMLDVFLVRRLLNVIVATNNLAGRLIRDAGFVNKVCQVSAIT